ncbi:MAG: EF-P beta-lysylation protein EpmB [Gammaproteobacteria bacterium]
MSRAVPATLATSIAPGESWQRALRDAVNSVEELLSIIDVDPTDVDWMQPTRDEFPLRVPRSYIARMRRKDPGDPLLRQVIPVAAELKESPGFSLDPLREVPLSEGGILEKYATRVLLITTGACPLHCRYCFRRHFPYQSNGLSRAAIEETAERLRAQPDSREVILSGGDPLSLSNARLDELVSALSGVESLTTLRIHSRFPIVLPERIDAGLLGLLRKSRLQVVVVTHSNHANEIDESVVAALSGLRESGATLLNQSVLLRGVNADAESLEALSYRLFEAGVLPYYLHQLDRVRGTAHFEIDDANASSLIAELRRRVPGYLVPRLVREIPGELSKTPLAESHL